MNWIEKYQMGGQAPTQESAEMDQQLNVLAQAMMQLQQIGAAAEQGDKQAQAIMGEVQRRAQAMMQGLQMAKYGGRLKKKEDGEMMEEKCGGKAKKRLVKKACGGPAKKANGGCACKKHLMRQGGKLVTVDCLGNIVD